MIQGGKLSGQFFGVFTLEMTQIERPIRNNEDYKMITGQDLTHDNSSVINSAGYVDDINHIASNHDKDKLEQTAQDIYRLTKHLYNENNLMVNNLKTQILQVEHNTAEAEDDDRKMVEISDTDNKKIKAQNVMKVLGVKLNAKGNLENHLSHMKSKIGIEHAKMKPYLVMMSQKDQKILIDSKLRSILDYGLPLYMG